MSNATTTQAVIRPVEIRRLLEASGWTQEDLAQRIGCRRITVGRWLAGVSAPKGANAKALHQLLDEWLID